MESKITLITPPDFFENGNLSLLFLSLTSEEQEAVSVWLKDNPIPENLNLYTYQGENSIPWLLYALSRSDWKYINVDTEDGITNVMASYILSKSNVYWHTANSDLKRVLVHLNNNYVESVESFLAKIFEK